MKATTPKLSLQTKVWRILRASAVCTYFSSLTLSLNLLQLLSMPVYPLCPRWVGAFNAFLASIIWRQMIALFRHDGARIRYTGDERVPEGEGALLVSNHVSFTEYPPSLVAPNISFYLLLSFAKQKGMLHASKYPPHTTKNLDTLPRRV